MALQDFLAKSEKFRFSRAFWNHFIYYLFGAQWIRAGDGMQIDRMGDHVVLRSISEPATPVTAVEPYCWQITDASEEGTANIEIAWGQFRSTRASNEGVPVPVTGTGTAYAVVTYSVSGEGVLTVTDLILAAGATVPESTDVALYIPVASYTAIDNDGTASVSIIQGVRTVLWAEVCLPNFVNVWAL
jgi:hypothetical protein